MASGALRRLGAGRGAEYAKKASAVIDLRNCWTMVTPPVFYAAPGSAFVTIAYVAR